VKDNLILEKTFAFAVRCYKLGKYLRETRKAFIAADQILRSGASIGANAEEANACHTKKDFAAKMQIAYREAKETHYWLRLLKDTGELSDHEAGSLLQDLDEIIYILTAILKSTRSTLD
jgi:four helix bundle protein